MIHCYQQDAADELLAAVKYYETQRPGLGGEFLDEIDIAIKKLKQSPKRWPIISGKARRYPLGRFPYNIFYEIHDSLLVIIAVAHQHRRPGYWKSRMRD